MLLLAAAPVAAQTTLVSNHGQTVNTNHLSTNGHVQAQGFRTGSHYEGYTLSAIEAVLNNTWTDNTQRDTVRAELWSNSSSSTPDAKLADLTVPGTFATPLSFAAPEGTTLAPNTSYFVVLYTTGTYDVGLGRVTTNNEDSGGAAGWSIWATRIAKQSQTPGSGSWLTGQPDPLRITIKGSPIQPAAVPAAPTNLSVALDTMALSLSWTAPAGTLTGYDVHYTSAAASGANPLSDGAPASGSDPALGWVAVTRTGTTASQTISGLTNSTPYRVRVRAVNAAGDGAWAFGTDTPEVITVLTGNLSQTIASGFSSVEDVNAQGFTTGADPYVVTSIDTWITQSADSAQRLTVRAELWSAAAGGGPGSKLADLTVPAIVSPGSLGLVAPRDTVLSPRTTYYFVLYTVGAYHIGQSYTAATAEDSIGLPGWSIEDTSWYITPHDVPASHTWSKSSGGEVTLIRVNGAALRLSVSADPACGTTVSDTSAQPAWVLRRTPAPASEKGVEWRTVDAEGGGLNDWAGANTVRPPYGYSSRNTRDNSFAELRAAFPDFAGIEFRLRNQPSVTASCTWRLGRHTTIWSATLTPVGADSVVVGCDNDITGEECTNSSTLSDDDFTYEGTDHSVTSIAYFALFTEFNVVVGPGIPQALRSGTLHVGSASFPMSSGRSRDELVYSTSAPDGLLTVGTPVTVSIVVPDEGDDGSTGGGGGGGGTPPGGGTTPGGGGGTPPGGGGGGGGGTPPGGGGGGGGGGDDDPDDPGDGGGGSGGGGPANRAPETAAEIADPMLRAGAALEIDLSDVFNDPDGDTLTYEAESSDESVATVEVGGDTLTVRGVGRGTTEITVTAEDADGRTASQTFDVTVTAPDTAWYLPPASDTLRQGFVRVLNHSDVAGEASIAATDDAGTTYEPLTLALGPRAARHFHTGDLESGNPARGLTGATGMGAGGWRLAIESETLDVEALAYVRTDDGFLAGLNDVAALEDGALAIPIFNPASNVDQTSHLRLVNPGDKEAEATVTATDDAGLSPGSPVVLTLPAGTACMVDAAQLESGTGLACGAPQDGLGDGSGKWRLAVESDKPLVAMSLLSSPAGPLANLSGKASPDWEDMWHVHLFPAASDPLGRQGVVRAVNPRSYRGTATVLAYDDSDTRYDALRLSLDAGQTAHFDSDDLELGNRAKGLTGSTGAGTGTWRLTMYGVGEAHAYVRAADGFLAAMNAVAPRARAVHRVAFFNPGTNRRTSVLRLVNRTRREAEVAIDGTDDLGLRPGTTVRVLVPATDAVELTAAELESGEHDAIASGALGDGTGKWRLRVESARLTAVMSLLSSPSGHLTNVSRADALRGFGDLPVALLPAPATVTLERTDDGHVEGRWSGAEDARYDVDLLRDGVRQEDHSLERTQSTSYRWPATGAGTYAIRARVVNEDGLGGPSRVSDEVVID